MLKTYLQALLSRFYSKKESALVGQQAMASTEDIILDCPSDFTDWGSYASGTAPCDGYLQISGASTDERASVLLRSECLYSAVFSPFNGGGFEGNISIAKGQSYFVDGASMSNVKLSIVKTIGETVWGGANSILKPILRSIQGGLLCLRNTCKLYLKPLSVVRKSGSANSLHQHIELILTSTKHRLSLQQRGHSLACSSIIALFLGTSFREANTEISFLEILPKLPILVLSKLKFARVRQLVAIPKVDHLKCSSFTAKAKSHNISFGGALC